MTKLNLSLDLFKGWINDTVDEHYENEPKDKWWAREKNADIKKKFHTEINKILKLSGDDHSYALRYSGWKKNKEFLYDFACLHFDKQPRDHPKVFLQEVILVMELEFSEHKIGHGTQGNIKYDFNKLLQSDAYFKLMGFQMKKADDVNQTLDELSTTIANYNSRVDCEYLLFGWAWEKSEFIFKRG